MSPKIEIVVGSKSERITVLDYGDYTLVDFCPPPHYFSFIFKKEKEEEEEEESINRELTMLDFEIGKQILRINL